MSIITKAVIPVAGFGTRFLPATKAQPKEMLPLVDKPIIQYIVEEAVASGIKEIIFVTNQNKRAIEDHFDRNFELEYRLKQGKKDALLKSISHIFKMAQFVYVRQPTPRGWGDALLQAEHLTGDESFAMIFADGIIDSKIPLTKQLIALYDKYRAPIIGTIPVKKSLVSRYGIIQGKKIASDTYKIQGIIEKPRLNEAPSNIAIIGPLILTPQIYPFLHKLKAAVGKEVNFYDAFNALLKKQPAYAYSYRGAYYDCGDKIDYLKATVAFGLRHPETGKEFKKFLKQTIS